MIVTFDCDRSALTKVRGERVMAYMLFQFTEFQPVGGTRFVYKGEDAADVDLNTLGRMARECHCKLEINYDAN